MNDRECMSVLSQGWLKSVFLEITTYIVVCYVIHHDMSSIFTPVFKTVSVQVL